MDIVKLTLADLAARIRAENDLIVDRKVDLIRRAIVMGGYLAEAKAQVKHGEWYSWVEENCPFGANQASKYLKAYERREAIEQIVIRNYDLLSLEDALRAVRALDAPARRREPAAAEIGPAYVPDGAFDPDAAWQVVADPMVERFNTWPAEARVIFMERLYLLFHRLASVTPEWRTPIEEEPLDD